MVTGCLNNSFPYIPHLSFFIKFSWSDTCLPPSRLLPPVLPRH